MAVGAPLHVRPELLGDDKHIQVIVVQLDGEALRTVPGDVVADPARAAFPVVTFRYRTVNSI